jgi:carbamoyltransferase
MYILGISAYYHDSSASIIHNGKIIAAVQEERFTRKKQDSSLPINSIEYCLYEANVLMSDIDAVVYYENPIIKLDRWLATFIGRFKISNKYQTEKIIKGLSQKMNAVDELRDCFKFIGKKNILYTVPHHYSHASSAFYPSPFESAAVMVLDGVGEWSTTTLGVGTGKELKLIKSIDFPNSLGLLYSAFTSYCGFKVNSGEYKLMGLAPYGEPIYAEKIKSKIINIKEDGSYALNMKYFSYLDSNIMVNEKFHNIFGVLPRESESKLTKEYMDIAASIQAVTEEIILKLAKKLSSVTGQKNLVMAGGVALNCSANGKLLLRKYFDNIWIQPASGDAGGSLGAALAYHYNKTNSNREVNGVDDSQYGTYLGPDFTNNEIEEYLISENIAFKKYDEDGCLKKAAELMADECIVGYFSGRMEYGPRSLGNRSILGDPRTIEMQTRMNLKIKFRESFRPFAPAVLEEKVSEYFDIDSKSPYMLLVAPVRKERCNDVDRDILMDNDYDMLEYLNQSRSDISSVTHVDYSARVQTVSKNTNPRFHKLLSNFENITGYPVCINTSFNVRGEPIVCTPEDAYRCFMRTDMDVLVLENYILIKGEQSKFEEDGDWREEYELD